MMTDYSIIVPTYRPPAAFGPFLGELHRELVRCYPGRFEIIVVDDGNDRDTRAAIERRCSALSATRVLSLCRNRGQQFATWAGMCAATGRVLLTMDDDGAHPPTLIGKLVAAVEDGAELVYAVPEHSRLPGDRRSWRQLLRRGGSWGNQILFQLLFNLPSRVRVSSFRALTAELRDRAVLRPQGHRAITRRPHRLYVSAMLLSRRPRTASVGYRIEQRGRVHSRYSWRALGITWCKIAWYWGAARLIGAERCFD